MAKVAFPARCAVAVVCGEHLVSQVYPASVPVEVFVDNIVELLNDEFKRRGLTGLESGVGYELHKVNGVRLDVTKTLDELGVEDGATLVLPPMPSKPLQPPSVRTFSNTRPLVPTANTSSRPSQPTSAVGPIVIVPPIKFQPLQEFPS